jgi:trimeric autotransporter adhesin
LILITEIRFLHVRPSLSSPKARPTVFGRLWTSALPLVVFFALVPTVADAQTTRIGSASSVTPEASGSVGGTLSVGSGVHANETVKTGSAGQAGLQFNDQSNLTVGHSSQVRLDKFVYDPNKGTGSTVIEATRGTFRFSTGAQNGGQVRIKTPYGTLGVRG